MCHDSASPFQLKIHGPDETYFWRTHQGAELDLMVVKGGKRIGIEIKRMDAPTLTPSMRIALSDLDLERLIVIYPGSRAYDLGPKVRRYLSYNCSRASGFLPGPDDSRRGRILSKR